MTNPPFPSLPLTVRVRGETYAGPALLDTGFEGDIIVPADLVGGFPGRTQDLVLADGSATEAPFLSGFAQFADFDNVPANVLFFGNEFVIGMGILSRYEVILDHGRRVIVNP